MWQCSWPFSLSCPCFSLPTVLYSSSTDLPLLPMVEQCVCKMLVECYCLKKSHQQRRKKTCQPLFAPDSGKFSQPRIGKFFQYNYSRWVLLFGLYYSLKKQIEQFQKFQIHYYIKSIQYFFQLNSCLLFSHFKQLNSWHCQH